MNRLLREGVDVYRGNGGDFFVKEASPKLLRAVQDSGLTLNTADLPKKTEPVNQIKVAMLKDGGTDKSQSQAGARLALEQMGFEVTELHPRQVAKAGLDNYDAFVYSGDSKLICWDLKKANREFGLKDKAQYHQFKEEVDAFVQGGGTYVAVGSAASEATKKLGLTDVQVHTGDDNSNGIVTLSNDADHSLTSGYKQEDIGFVYRPGWYTRTEGVTVAASYGNGEFFQSGH